MSLRRITFLAFISAALVSCLTPFGTTQVPVDILPPYSLQSSEDFGSLRESLRALNSNAAIGYPISDLRFRKTWTSGSSVLYVGSYTAPSNTPAWATSATSALLQTPTNHQLIYVHQVGGPCLVPPDSVYAAPITRPQTRTKRSSEISNAIQLGFLLYLLESVEQGDPDGSLPQVLAQLAIPNQALFDLSLSNSGTFVSCELEFGDLSDLSAPTTSLVVEATFDGVSFGSVSVR